MKNVKYRIVGDGYESIGSYTEHSKRYDKTITIKDGFFSDGATDAPDIDTDGWWFHDAVCRYGKWDDGSPITNWQASTVLYDILMRDGFSVRAHLWRIGTFLFGGGAARDNGMFFLSKEN